MLVAPCTLANCGPTGPPARMILTVPLGVQPLMPCSKLQLANEPTGAGVCVGPPGVGVRVGVPPRGVGEYCGVEVAPVTEQ